MMASLELDIELCPDCGFRVHFVLDQYSRVGPACDQCARNRDRAVLGLPPIIALDRRRVPPPSAQEARDFDLDGALDRDFASGKLVADYLAGLSTVKLAARYHVTPRRINSRLHKAAVPMRPGICGIAQVNANRRSA